MGINFTDIATTAPVIAATFNDPLDQLDQAIKKNNYAATAAPGVGDDSADGYTVGSRWIDTTNDRIYIAVDVTVGAAIWLEIGNDSISLSAQDFGSVTSSAATASDLGDSANQSEAKTWACNDANTQGVGAAIPYRGSRSGANIAVDIYWAMEAATSGVVRILYAINAIGNGEAFDVTQALSASDETVPGTAKLVKKTTVSKAEAYVAGDIVRLFIGRSGSAVQDTASGNFHLLAVMVRFLP